MGGRAAAVGPVGEGVPGAGGGGGPGALEAGPPVPVRSMPSSVLGSGVGVNKESVVRTNAILCAQVVAKKCMKAPTAAWFLYLPESQGTLARPFTPSLATCLLHDPVLRVRETAAGVCVLASV